MFSFLYLKVCFISPKRSILEQSSAIWHSSITEENRTDLERVQKNAFRNILKEEYTDYNRALKRLNLESLNVRRENLLVKYGKKCLQLEHTKDLFPLHTTKHTMNTRKQKKFKETQCNTERLQKSMVPYLQRLMNLT